MRPDQIQRLQDLAEKLADNFIFEADPQEWPGQGKAPAEMSQQERGDAYWCKKNAMATGGVLRYTLDLVANHSTGKPDDASKDVDLDKRIRDAEKRAAAAVERVIGKAKGEFDKRVHGNAGKR
jgi:hypothetical protein